MGDTAILTAMMQGLTQQSSAPTFSGIMMDLEAVRRSHGIPGIAMVGAPIRFFSYFGLEQRRNLLYRAARVCWRLVKFPAAEAAHLIRAMRFLRRVSLFVVAGGGQLDEEWGGPWALPYQLFKWTLIARLAGVPVVFLSVGVGNMKSRLGHWFIRHALERASLVSLRTSWSRRYVEERTKCRRLYTVPDAAFGLDPLVALAPPNSSPRLKIGVSPIAYGRPELWPTHDSGGARHYFGVLVGFTKELLAAGNSVVLFSTDTPDRILVEEMRASLQAQVTDEQFRRLEVRLPSALAELLEAVAPLDLVIASRLHGVILSHVLQRPVLAISYDRKVATYMTESGYGRFCMEFGQVTEGLIAAGYETLAAERASVHEDLCRKTASWKVALTEQYSAAIALMR